MILKNKNKLKQEDRKNTSLISKEKPLKWMKMSWLKLLLNSKESKKLKLLKSKLPLMLKLAPLKFNLTNSKLKLLKWLLEDLKIEMGILNVENLPEVIIYLNVIPGIISILVIVVLNLKISKHAKVNPITNSLSVKPVVHLIMVVILSKKVKNVLKLVLKIGENQLNSDSNNTILTKDIENSIEDDD